MGINPIPFLIVATFGLIFNFALEGQTYASESFAKPGSPDTVACSSNGFFSSIECALSTIITYAINAFNIIIGAISFLVRGLLFYIPGAPWYVQAPISIIFGGTITLSIVSILRGN